MAACTSEPDNFLPVHSLTAFPGNCQTLDVSVHTQRNPRNPHLLKHQTEVPLVITLQDGPARPKRMTAPPYVLVDVVNSFPCCHGVLSPSYRKLEEQLAVESSSNSRVFFHTYFLSAESQLQFLTLYSPISLRPLEIPMLKPKSPMGRCYKVGVIRKLIRSPGGLVPL